MKSAYLIKVMKDEKVRVKLPQYTDEDPDDIIQDVKKGTIRFLTRLGCEECKADLEEDGAAEVLVE